MPTPPYRLIPLYGRKGVIGHAKVSPEDYERLSRTRWNRTPHGYAVGYVTIDGQRRHVRMHRYLLDMPMHTVEGNGRMPEVDHINRDKLDNRRENLRICTRAQNMQNRGSKKGATSRHRNVHFDKRTQKWVVQVTLGHFASEDEAAETAQRFRKVWLPYATD